MSKKELLKSLGFSDDFLKKIEEYDASIIEIEPSFVESKKEILVHDFNNLIIEKDASIFNNNIYISSPK